MFLCFCFCVWNVSVVFPPHFLCSYSTSSYYYFSYAVLVFNTIRRFSKAQLTEGGHTQTEWSFYQEENFQAIHLLVTKKEATWSIYPPPWNTYFNTSSVFVNVDDAATATADWLSLPLPMFTTFRTPVFQQPFRSVQGCWCWFQFQFQNWWCWRCDAIIIVGVGVVNNNDQRVIL